MERLSHALHCKVKLGNHFNIGCSVTGHTPYLKTAITDACDPDALAVFQFLQFCHRAGDTGSISNAPEKLTVCGFRGIDTGM